MAEFTRGPWTVDETNAFGAYGVWTDYATHPGHDGAGYPSQICSMLPATKSEITREQRDANARLIAGAPGLLATLESLVAAVQGLSNHDRVREELERAQEAIREARDGK